MVQWLRLCTPNAAGLSSIPGQGARYHLEQLKFPHVCSVVQPCLTLRDSMNCNSPGSSVHGIFQARILEWVAISYSRGSSWPRNWTHISCTGRQILYHWDTWEASHASMEINKYISSYHLKKKKKISTTEADVVRKPVSEDHIFPGLIFIVVQSLSHVQLFAMTLWTVAHQAPLSMAFCRQEYLSGLPFPSPGDLPKPEDRTHVSCIGRQVCNLQFANEKSKEGRFAYPSHQPSIMCISSATAVFAHALFRLSPSANSSNPVIIFKLKSLHLLKTRTTKGKCGFEIPWGLQRNLLNKCFGIEGLSGWGTRVGKKDLTLITLHLWGHVTVLLIQNLHKTFLYADSWTSPQTYWNAISKGRPRNLHFNKLTRWIWRKSK